MDSVEVCRDAFQTQVELKHESSAAENSQANSPIPDVEVAVGKLWLLCPRHRVLEGADKVGLLGDYKVKCGAVRTR
jgi:hypothetical protein